MMTAIVLALLQVAVPAVPATDGAPPVQVVRRGPPPPDAVRGDGADAAMPLIEGLPTVTVSAGGTMLRLGFDTGAGGVRLTPQAAERLRLVPMGEGLATDPSGRNPVPITLYKLASLTIGGVTMEGLPASASPSRPTARDGLDGIIGPAAFPGFVIALDYAHGRFRLRRGTLPAADGEHVFGYDGGVPTLPLVVEGRTIAAHLDTGNTRFPVIVPTAFAASLAHRAAAHPIGEAHTISTTVQMSAVTFAAPAMLGGVALSAREIGWPSVVPIANVGSLALAGLVVEVDPAGHRVRLLPATR